LMTVRLKVWLKLQSQKSSIKTRTATKVSIWNSLITDSMNFKEIPIIFWEAKLKLTETLSVTKININSDFVKNLFN
jgi:hypothetical protein